MSARGNGRMIAGLLTGTLLFLVIALTGPALWQMLHPGPVGDGAATVATRDLPWQIETLEDGGTRVFGVRPGQDTIARIASTWPAETADMKVALVRDPQGRLTLEAYLENVRAGFVQGRVVLTGQADDATLQRWESRASAREPQPSGSYRLTLRAEDEAQARGATLVALAFLPAARIDEAAATERFGAPAERIAGPDGMVNLLYPARGLSISLDPQGRGKPVLQYVAPRDFATRLRAPLLQAPRPGA